MKKLLAAPTRETAKGLRDRALLILLALYGLPVIEAHRLNVRTSTCARLASVWSDAEEAALYRTRAGHNYGR